LRVLNPIATRELVEIHARIDRLVDIVDAEPGFTLVGLGSLGEGSSAKRKRKKDTRENGSHQHLGKLTGDFIPSAIRRSRPQKVSNKPLTNPGMEALLLNDVPQALTSVLSPKKKGQHFCRPSNNQ
jgi:hypothetical protein